jgi:hypothetical protein
MVSVVPVISDCCSGCSGGFVPVVPFRLFRVLVHAGYMTFFPEMKKIFWK